MNMSSAAPSAKVWAATLAAFVAPMLLAFLKARFPGLPLPDNAGDIVAQLVQGAIVGALTFGASYLKSPSRQDVAVVTPPPAPPSGIPPSVTT